MYPPVPLLIRKANEDYHIEGSNHVIYKGQQVIIPLVAFHYDDRYWDEPKRFNPDRFSTHSNKKNGSFMPFGKSLEIKNFYQFNFKTFSPQVLGQETALVEDLDFY